MSGGVDSSVVAYLLKKEGYDVVGATMRLIDSSETDKSINDAKDEEVNESIIKEA